MTYFSLQEIAFPPLQLCHGEERLSTYDTKLQTLTVAPHGVWKGPLLGDSLKRTRRGKAVIVNNTLEIKVFLVSIHINKNVFIFILFCSGKCRRERKTRNW